MENIKQNFQAMFEYCFDNNIKCSSFFLPKNDLYEASTLHYTFTITLKNDLRGEMQLKVICLQDIHNAIKFFNSPVPAHNAE
jgi:hypothetical protein